MVTQDFPQVTFSEILDPFGIMSTEQRDRWLAWISGAWIPATQEAFVGAASRAKNEFEAHCGGERPTTNRRPEPP